MIFDSKKKAQLDQEWKENYPLSDSESRKDTIKKRKKRRANTGFVSPAKSPIPRNFPIVEEAKTKPDLKVYKPLKAQKSKRKKIGVFDFEKFQQELKQSLSKKNTTIRKKSSRADSKPKKSEKTKRKVKKSDIMNLSKGFLSSEKIEKKPSTISRHQRTKSGIPRKAKTPTGIVSKFTTGSPNLHETTKTDKLSTEFYVKYAQIVNSVVIEDRRKLKTKKKTKRQ